MDLAPSEYLYQREEGRDPILVVNFIAAAGVKL
jgi:hypothetical protein